MLPSCLNLQFYSRCFIINPLFLTFFNTPDKLTQDKLILDKQ